MVNALGDVSSKTFDFVIIGGGTAGLTLAARLSEDASVTVAVLEAGQANLDDPMIDIPGQFSRVFGDPKYDWAHQTTPQLNMNGRTITWNRGKALGGSSAINYYNWTKPPAADIDVIGRLGIEGWNWQELMEYSKLSETFHPATEEQLVAYPHTYRPEYRGTSGPVQVTIPHHVATLDHVFQKALSKRGVKQVDDPMGGDNCGMWMSAANLDRRTWTRSYAATAYYKPNVHRENLVVVTEVLASRILFDDTKNGADLVATGVEFLFDGQPHIVHARREVILSAGAIKTPQLLELSGIGRPNVLEKIGVQCKVDLAGVGENVQDHLLYGITYEIAMSHETFDRMFDPEYATDALDNYKAGKHSMLRLGVLSHAFLPLDAISDSYSSLVSGLENAIHKAKLDPKSSPGLAEQLDVQLDIVKNPKVPDTEFLAFPACIHSKQAPEPGKSYLTVLMMLEHPFSRGTIHAASNKPTDDPIIDAHYLEYDFDLQLMVEQFKFTRSLRSVEPLKSDVIAEVSPGPECVTDEQIRNYVKDHSTTCWHAVGSTSMLPREKGGVVNSSLNVYGTSNLRVVDLGIMPLQLACHTQSVVYALAEKAADIIRGRKRV